jgi:SIR2-like domain
MRFQVSIDQHLHKVRSRESRMISASEQYLACRSRLQFAYDAGRLVPFLGSGMSFPACRLWKGLIEQLEVAAGFSSSSPTTDHPSPGELTRRANRAVQQLRISQSADKFADSLREALHLVSTVPLTTASLAKTFWPLVMTTNYDDLFWTAFIREQGTSQKVLGRSVSDCHAILSSLRTPSEPILWAVQGFLGHICSCPLPRNRMNELAKEVVVGHQEYRKVTFNSPHFRRAFAEVFRSRSSA